MCFCSARSMKMKRAMISYKGLVLERAFSEERLFQRHASNAGARITKMIPAIR